MNCPAEELAWHETPTLKCVSQDFVRERYVILGGKRALPLWLALQTHWSRLGNRNVMLHRVPWIRPKVTCGKFPMKIRCYQWLPPSGIEGSSLLFTGRKMYLAVWRFGGNAVEMEDKSEVNKLLGRMSYLEIVGLGMPLMVERAWNRSSRFRV